MLDAVATQLRDGSSRRKLKSWVRKVRTSARRDEVRERLVADGVLVAEERRILGFIPTTRHALADPAAVERLADRVRDVLTGARPPDERSTVLAAIVGSTAVLDRLVPKGERRAARRRAEELAESSPIAAAARTVIRDTQAAMIATFAGAAGAASGN